MQWKSLLTGMAFAVSTWAAPCQDATLQDYIDLGATGCTSGLVSFSNFLKVDGQAFATEIDPALVAVAPAGSGLRFTLSQTAGADEFFESFFRFRAAGPIQGTSLTLLDSSASGSGIAAAGVDLCVDATFAGPGPAGCGGAQNTLIALVVDGFAANDQNGTFASFFDVFFDLTVDGGPQGQAFLGSAELTFQAVPEPSTFVLAVPVLAAMFWRRTRKSQRSES